MSMGLLLGVSLAASSAYCSVHYLQLGWSQYSLVRQSPYQTLLRSALRRFVFGLVFVAFPLAICGCVAVYRHDLKPHEH